MSDSDDPRAPGVCGCPDCGAVECGAVECGADGAGTAEASGALIAPSGTSAIDAVAVSATRRRREVAVAGEWMGLVGARKVTRLLSGGCASDAVLGTRCATGCPAVGVRAAREASLACPRCVRHCHRALTEWKDDYITYAVSAAVRYGSMQLRRTARC